MTFHVKQLHDYQEVLATTGVEWGLIGPREVDRLWERHIDNCLAVTEDDECLPASCSVIDIGSGAGLPGLVWAIGRPDLTVTLVEPLERRVRFLNQVVEELALTNVTVLRARAQDVDVRAVRVTARAVSATKTLLPWLAPLVSPGGRMVLLKGRRADQELREADQWLRRSGWVAGIREVGEPPRTRVVVVKRRGKG